MTERSRGKRAHGDGTIFQRADDGRWIGELMVGYRPDGRKDVRRTSAKTQAECRKKLSELRLRFESGTLTTKDKDAEALAAYLGRWLTSQQPSVRPSTHRRYTELLTLHVIPELGKYRLSKLRPEHVQTLYAHLLQKPAGRGQGRTMETSATLSPRTVHHVHVVLHTALEQAVRWGYLARNVCDAVDAPRVHRPETYTPSTQEMRRFLDRAAEKTDPFLALWTVAIYTGCRLGELLGLQWPDLDLEAGTLSVRRALLLSTRGGIPAYGEPKTARSRRTITLPASAVEALRGHRAAQLERRLLLGPDYAAFDLVFASHTGTPLSHRNVLRAFKVALAHAELPATIRIHDLRHGAATLMLKAGVPLKVASERLGHSAVGITADLYTHTVASLEADAAAKLERALNG